MDFKLESEYSPTGDQPQAIDKLVEGIENGEPSQTLLGVTGSGKTFTMGTAAANIEDDEFLFAELSFQSAARLPISMGRTPLSVLLLTSKLLRLSCM